MKIQLENIIPNANSSFRWLINPKLNDFFFWHFHPEYELVFIEAEEGTRHVGEHISRYQNNDLVLIGSDIPHLNFDYGIKTEYKKTVLHIQPHFLENAFTPELKSIETLLECSKRGIVFGEKSKEKIQEIFKEAHQLPYFEQFVEILKVFKILSEAEDITYLHEQIPKNAFNKKEQERLQKVYRFIDEHYQQKIRIEVLADLSNLSEAAFCRFFKRMTKLTFTDFFKSLPHQ